MLNDSYTAVIIQIRNGVNNMKILICDDNQMWIDQTTGFLKKYTNEKNIRFDIKTYTSSELAAADKTRFDIAFVDIEMPKIDGLTLISILQKRNPHIAIFVVTFYGCYLDEAMDLNAFRFIVKPIESERFFRGMDAAIRNYKKLSRKLTLDYADETYSIFSTDIIYVTTQNDHVQIVTDDRQYVAAGRLKEWFEKLSVYPYFSVPHHSYIVNLNYVSYFNRREIFMKNKKQVYRIPVSQRGYPTFKTDYYSFVGNGG